MTKSRLSDEQWAELEEKAPGLYGACRAIEEIEKFPAWPKESSMIMSREQIRNIARDMSEFCDDLKPGEITDNDRELVKDLFLYYECGHTFFRAQLYSLMPKADVDNLAQLKRGFPDEYRLFWEWHKTPNPEDFYRKYKIGGLLRGEEKDVYNKRFGGGSDK